MNNRRKIAVNALLILAGAAMGIFIAAIQPDRNIHLVRLTVAAIVGLSFGAVCKNPGGGLIVVPLTYVVYLVLAPPL